MNWTLENLTPEQQRAIDHFGYVGAFWGVLVPRLLATVPPRIVPLPPPPVGTPPSNDYVPLAHRLQFS